MKPINLWTVQHQDGIEYYLLADSIADIGRFLIQQDCKNEWNRKIVINPVAREPSVTGGYCRECYDIRQEKDGEK